jgi:hypothetical protein
MRPDNAASHLADAQSARKEAAKGEKGVVRDALMHPPDARPRTPAEGCGPLHSQTGNVDDLYNRLLLMQSFSTPKDLVEIVRMPVLFERRRDLYLLK